MSAAKLKTLLSTAGLIPELKLINSFLSDTAIFMSNVLNSRVKKV